MPLSARNWVLKSICLPGGICVSFSGSPELAWKSFRHYRECYPHGTSCAAVLEFFEKSSAETNNDYIIAFAATAKLVTIRGGRRATGISQTHWIGDKEAFERFREYEHDRGRQYECGRAVNAAWFADEMAGSPASDLYSIMRSIVVDRNVKSVGGFVSVLSNRDIGFRFAVYSDALFDWPLELSENQIPKATDKHDLLASGENERYSVSQISPGYYNMNAVAFYILTGRLLVLLFETQGGEMRCTSVQNVEPGRIADAIDAKLSFPFRAMCLVMSSRGGAFPPIQRTADDGVGMRVYCEANTMPKISS